jgi:hypothetical protein
MSAYAGMMKCLLCGELVDPLHPCTRAGCPHDHRTAAELTRLTARVAELEAENKGLGQLLAHLHVHLTCDENFDADELASDIRKMAGGTWIDTETVLLREREARIAAERERDELRRENERLRALETLVQQLQIGALAVSRTGVAGLPLYEAALKDVITFRTLAAQEGGNG